MKITDRFMGDHKTFRKLMVDIGLLAESPLTLPSRKRLVRLVELLKDHLLLHAWGEEQFYYPVVQQALPPNAIVISRTYMDQLDTEHKVIDQAINQLEKDVNIESTLSSWIVTFQVFGAALTNHMAKEETELFPFSEGLLGKEGLEKISLDLEKHRREAPAIRRHSSE